MSSNVKTDEDGNIVIEFGPLFDEKAYLQKIQQVSHLKYLGKDYLPSKKPGQPDPLREKAQWALYQTQGFHRPAEYQPDYLTRYHVNLWLASCQRYLGKGAPDEQK